MRFAGPSIVADVLVLGAGPGGAAAALHLDRLGVAAAVLEARGAVATRPNVVDMSPEAVASAGRAGFETVFDGRMGASRRGQAGAAVSLSAFENHGRSLLAAADSPVSYDTRVVGLADPLDDLVHLRLEDGRTASGRYVLNATGGRSGIEDALGMGLSFHGDWTWVGAARTPHVSQLESGTRLGGFLGQVRGERAGRMGELEHFVDPVPVPEEVARFRGAGWYGWQNPRDGLSLFQSIGTAEFQKFSPAELGQRILAPARAHGMRDVLDAPRLLRIESASVERARSGNVLALGDAAGRPHAKQMIGTQLAVLDAERAAHAVAAALREPGRASALLDEYDVATRAAHAEFGHDGTRVLADDPLRGLGADVLELDRLDAWPTGLATAAGRA